MFLCLCFVLLDFVFCVVSLGSVGFLFFIMFGSEFGFVLCDVLFCVWVCVVGCVFRVCVVLSFVVCCVVSVGCLC